MLSLAAALMALVLAGCSLALLARAVLDSGETAFYRAHLRQQTQRIVRDTMDMDLDEKTKSSEADSPGATLSPWWGRPLLRSRGGPVELMPLCELYAPMQRIPRLLERAGLGAVAEGLVQWWLLGTGLGMMLAGVAGSLPLACAVGVLSVAGGFMALQSRVEKRRQALRAALPDMLDGLAQALRAGQSFPQAVKRALQAEQADSPVAELLRRLDADMTLGRSNTESIAGYARENNLRELRTLATVMGIVGRVGGNTPLLFEQIATTTRQDLLLNRKLKVQTAQGRMSVRLVGSVPFVLIALMSLAMPGYLATWFASSGGQILFTIALCLIIIGFLWVRKVVNIRV